MPFFPPMFQFVPRGAHEVAEAIIAINQGMGTLSGTIDNMETNVMAALADIQAALSATEDREKRMMDMMAQQSQEMKDMAAKLAAAQASGDPVAIQAVVDQMNADTAAMDAALAAAAPPAAAPAPAAPQDAQPPAADPASGATPSS